MTLLLLLLLMLQLLLLQLTIAQAEVLVQLGAVGAQVNVLQNAASDSYGLSMHAFFEVVCSRLLD
jgi:hypothetical protein